MAIPRGYRRNSSGFLDPIGTVRSGRVSGPTAAQRDQDPLMDISDLIPGAKGKARASDRASYLSRTKAASDKHMAFLKGERNSKAAARQKKIETILKGLAESKKNDPKDALGNTIPSKGTMDLEAAAARALEGYVGPGRGAVPRRGDVQGIPGVRKFEQTAEIMPQVGPVDKNATSDLLRRPGTGQEPGAGYNLQEMEQLREGGLKPENQMGQEVLPSDAPATTTRGDKVTLTGQQRQGAKEMEFLVVNADGREAWLPRSQFQLDQQDEPGQGRGEINLQRLYEKPAQDFQPF